MTASVVTPQQKNADPIIMILTAGQATDGVTDLAQIQKRIKAENQVQQVPIFSLGFGSDVEFPFLRKLSIQNGAVARVVYEGSDAASQIQSFYGEIAYPALSNLNISYTSDLYQVTDLTRTSFPRFFKGSEIIVAGKVETNVKELNDPCQSYCVNGKLVLPANVTSSAELNLFTVEISTSNMTKVRDPADIVLCESRTTSAADVYGLEDLFDQDERDSFTEKLWAYLTIKQLLEQAEAEDVNGTGGASGDENPAQRALDLALRVGYTRTTSSVQEMSKILE